MAPQSELRNLVFRMKVGESRLFSRKDLLELGLIDHNRECFPPQFRMLLPIPSAPLWDPDCPVEPAVIQRAGMWQLKYQWSLKTRKRILHGEYERVA